MARVKRAVHSKKKRRATLERAPGLLRQQEPVLQVRQRGGHARRAVRVPRPSARARATSGRCGSSGSTPRAARTAPATAGSSPACASPRSRSTARSSPTSPCGSRPRSPRWCRPPPRRWPRRAPEPPLAPALASLATASASASRRRGEASRLRPRIRVTVVGPRHASVQRLRRLSGRRSARHEEAAFVIDGPVLLREALAAGVAVEEVFATSDADAGVVAAAEAAGAAIHEVTQEVLARAVDTVTPNGLAAIARRVEVSVDDALAAGAAGPLMLVLVDVSDPGNAGTLLRAAEASGAAAVLFCGSSVDPSNAKCVRASAGALFHVPVATGADVLEVLEHLRRHGVRTVGHRRGRRGALRRRRISRGRWPSSSAVKPTGCPLRCSPSSTTR